MDDFDAKAIEISSDVTLAYELPLLDEASCADLATCLRELSPEGKEMALFETEHKHPRSDRVDETLRRIHKQILILCKAKDNDDPVSRAAQDALLGSVHDELGDKTASDVEAFLKEAARLGPLLSDVPLRAEVDIEREYQRNGLEYQTYVAGSEFPHLFRRLYPSTPFNLKKEKYDSLGLGPFFVSACCEAIGLKPMKHASVLKAIQRVRDVSLEKRDIPF